MHLNATASASSRHLQLPVSAVCSSLLIKLLLLLCAFEMSCRVKFTFLKGPCLDKAITHDFDGDTTVAQMKQFLVEAHHACDPSSQSLSFVWEEQGQKMTNDDQTAASLGATAGITVNIIRKPTAPPPSAPSVIDSPASSVGNPATSAVFTASATSVAAVDPQSVDGARSISPTTAAAALGPDVSVLDAYCHSPNTRLAASSHVAGSQIILGVSGTGAEPSKVRIGTAQGSIEVLCHDEDATVGSLRAVLVSRGLCTQEAPIILSVLR